MNYANERRKEYLRFKENIWALSSFNYDVKFLLCVIDTFTQNVCVKSLKDTKVKTVLNSFTGIGNKSKRKPNKLWIDQGREYCNNLM